MKFGHGPMKRTDELQVIKILAEVAEHLALAGFDNLEQGDGFGRAAQRHAAFHAAVRPQNIGFDEGRGDLRRVTRRRIDVLGNAGGRHRLLGFAHEKEHQGPQGRL